MEPGAPSDGAGAALLVPDEPARSRTKPSVDNGVGHRSADGHHGTESGDSGHERTARGISPRAAAARSTGGRGATAGMGSDVSGRGPERVRVQAGAARMAAE